MEEEKKETQEPKKETIAPGASYSPYFPYPSPPPPPQEIDLYELFLILLKRKKIIFLITFLGCFLGICIALFSPNIYRAQAIIMPTETPKMPNLGALGTLGQLAGLSIPVSANTAELITLLKADHVREEMIKKYNLLPILFPDRWDPIHKKWKPPEQGFFSIIKKVLFFPKNLFSILAEKLHKTSYTKKETKENPFAPTIDDALRKLNSIYSISQDKKLGTIVVSADFYDPELSAWLVKILLQTLKDYISREAIITAEKNLEILKKELPKVGDPLLRQKLQELIAKNIETKVMAKVNREFVFKILEPPRPPDRRFKPKRTLIVMVSFVSSLFLGIFLAFFLEYVEKVKEKRTKETS